MNDPAPLFALGAGVYIASSGVSDPQFSNEVFFRGRI
jgi:hypothetical protein